MSEDKEAKLRLTSDVQGALSGLDQVGKGMATLNDRVKKAGDFISDMGKKFLAVSASIGAAFAPIVKSGMEFEKAMSTVQMRVGELGESSASVAAKMQGLNKSLLDMGGTSRITLTELVGVIGDMTQHGYTAAQAMENVGSVTRLAGIMGKTAAEAFSQLDGVMKVFGVEADHTQHVVDTLAVSAKVAGVATEEFIQGTRMAGMMVAEMGVSLETTTKYMAILAAHGMEGARAGRTFSQMVTKLSSETKASTKVLRDYGLTFEDVSLETHTLEESLEIIKKKGIEAGDVMKAFGAKTGSMMLKLMNDSKTADKVAEAQSKSAGAAAEILAMKAQTLSTNWAKLKVAFEAIRVDMYQQFAATIAGIVKQITAVVVEVKKWVAAHHEIVATFGNILAKMSIMGTVIGTVLIAVGKLAPIFVSSFGVISTIVSGIATVLTSFPALLVAAVAIPVIMAAAAAWKEILAAVKSVYEGAIKPLIGGAIQGFQQLWAFVKPMFDELVVAVKNVATQFAALFNSASVQAFFGLLGKLLGWVAGIIAGAVVGAITILATMLGGLLSVINGVNDGLIEMGRFLGILGNEAETSTERMNRLNKARQALQATDAGYMKQMQASNDLEATAATHDEKLIALWEKQNELLPEQQKQLSELLKTGGTSVQAIASRIKAEQAEIAALEAKIQKYKEVGMSTADLEVRLARKKSIEEQDQKTLDALTKLEKEHGSTLYRTAEAVDDAMAAEKARADIRKAGADAADRDKEQMKELKALEKELGKADKTDIEAEIVALDELREQRQFLITTRLLDLDARVLAAKLAGTSTAALDMEIDRVKKLSQAIEDNTTKKMIALQDKDEEARRRVVEKSQEEQLKLADDKVALAEATNKRELEDLEKTIKEKMKIRQGHEIEDQKAIDQLRANQAKISDDRTRKAFEEQWKKDKKNLGGEVEKHAKVEEDVTMQLAKQVHSVQQMFVLYQALAIAREQQDQRSTNASMQALKSEEMLERLHDRQNKSKIGSEEAKRLDSMIRKQQLLVDLQKATATRETGLAHRGDPAAIDAGAATDTLKKRMDTSKQALILTKVAIDDMMKQVKEAFAKAPDSWVDAFLETWPAALKRMQDELGKGMSTLKKEMDPDTRHSPSLKDVWKMNMEEVGRGVNRIGSLLAEHKPNMRSLNFGSMIQPRVQPLSMGGMRPGPTVKEYNDNRNVSMQIHNNVDLQEVRRNIGQALADAHMDAGTI